MTRHGRPTIRDVAVDTGKVVMIRRLLEGTVAIGETVDKITATIAAVVVIAAQAGEETLDPMRIIDGG